MDTVGTIFLSILVGFGVLIFSCACYIGCCDTMKDCVTCCCDREIQIVELESSDPVTSDNIAVDESQGDADNIANDNAAYNGADGGDMDSHSNTSSSSEADTDSYGSSDSDSRRGSHDFNQACDPPCYDEVVGLINILFI